MQIYEVFDDLCLKQVESYDDPELMELREKASRHVEAAVYAERDDNYELAESEAFLAREALNLLESLEGWKSGF